MRILCDTNIWYQNDLQSMISNKDHTFLSSFITVDEVTKTDKLVNETNCNLVRLAIKQICKNNQFICEPPFHRLLVESFSGYIYDISQDQKLYDFLSKISRGYELSDNEKALLRNYNQYRRKRQEIASEFFSDFINRHHIVDKRKLRISHGINTREFIPFVVESITGHQFPVNFNWSKIELFEKVLDYYFFKMGSSKINVKVNDWFDLALLAYVRPNEKFWTYDNRLKSLIIESGMNKYLYD